MIATKLGTQGARALIMPLAPAGWYRFGQGLTVATGVSAWADQSGNGRTLVQATGGSQPALQSDGSVLFDGSDDFLATAGALSLAQPVSIYALLRQVTWTSGEYFVDLGAAAGGAVIRQNSAAASPAVSLIAGGTNASTNDLAVGTYGVIRAVLNGASSLIGINNGTESTADAGANAPSGVLSLGAANNGAGASNIQVKELIVFAGAHSAAQRAAITSYLMTVGGL